MNKKIISLIAAAALVLNSSATVFAENCPIPDSPSDSESVSAAEQETESSSAADESEAPLGDSTRSWTPVPDALRSGDYEYIVDDRTFATVTRYVGNQAHVSMPEKIDGHLITEIGENAFRDTLIHSVSVGASVKTVGARAFMDCPNLTTVAVSEKIETIGEKAYGYTDENTKLPGFTMSGTPDTAASAYAAENGFEFSRHYHNYTAGVMIQRATCVHEGKIALYCEDCGYRHIDRVLKYRHNYTKKLYTVEPTLSEEGYTLYRCRICKATKKLDIKPKLSDISGAEISGIKDSYAYTGSAVCPEPTVKINGTALKKDTDYTLSYANNNAIGTASVTVTGINGYTGSKTVNFTLRQALISECEISGLKQYYKYTGKARKPKPTLTVDGYTLVLNTDYTLSYNNNVNVGTAVITITGKGNFSGRSEAFFSIVRQGWYTENGRKYYYDNAGNMIRNQIYKIGSDEYYFNGDGVMQTSWQKIDGQYYFFGRLDGKRVTGQNVDGIAIGADGSIYLDSWGLSKVQTMMTAHKVVEENTLPTDTMEQKRLKVFKWLFPFPYHRFRLLAPIYHQLGWEMTFANDIFRYRAGCCVSEAAACAFMFHEIGYETVYVAHDSSHAWVEMNGRVYDPLFAEAKSFSANYDVVIPPGQYRSNPVQRRKI